MIKRLFIAVLLLGLVGGGIVWFNLFRDRMIGEFFASMKPPPQPVDTVVAEGVAWTPMLEAIGTVYAANGIELAVEAGGVVREIRFQPNDRVEAGQVLVRIADEVEQADLMAAEAQIKLTEQALARLTSLASRGVAAESSIEEAQANLSSARAQAQKMEALIDQKVLVAPFAGEIGIPQIEVGQFITIGTAVATLQDVDSLRVDFSVPEQSRPLIQIGQAMTAASETGAEASGFITAIEPRIDPATRLVSVRATLDNHEGILSPGQFVRVRIALEVQDGVVALPQTAIVTSLYGDYVYAVRPAEGEGAEGLVARQVFVKTGSRQEALVEVTSGVAPGDRVVIAGQNRLSNGSPVTLSGEPAAADPTPAEAAAAPAEATVPDEHASPADAAPTAPAEGEVGAPAAAAGEPNQTAETAQ